MKKTILYILASIVISFGLLSNVSAKQQVSNQNQKLLEEKYQCPIVPGRFYTHSNTKSVWKITSKVPCTKRPVQSEEVFFTHADSWSEIKTVSAKKITQIKDDSVGFVPKGPKYNPKGGALVKIPSDNKVYLLLDGKKYWITKESVFNDLNYKWSWIESVSPKLLGKYETKGEINFTDHHPVGSLVKYPNSQKVYRLDRNNGEIVKRHIKSPKIFKKLNYRFNRVVTIDKSEKYTTGQPVTTNNYNSLLEEKKSQTEQYSDSQNKTKQQNKSASNNLYPARKNGKWGYINQQGSWVIKPQFNYAKPFFEGRAVINTIPANTFNDAESKWGIIDKQGDFVVKPKYYSRSSGAVPHSPIGHYSQGLASVNVKTTFGSYKKKEDRDKVFYLDKDGNKKIVDKFSQVGQFSDGLALIKNEQDEVGYINKQGKIVIQPKYNAGLLFSSNLIPVQQKGETFGGWKFINKQDKTKISGPFDGVSSFYNGLAKLEEGTNLSYINTRGDSELNVDSFGVNTNFHEDRAIITKEITDFKSHKILVDRDGKEIFDFQNLNYEVCGAEPFHNGLAQIIISSDGGCVINYISPDSGGFSDVVTQSTSSRYAYINKQGKIVYKEKSRASHSINSLTKSQKKEIKKLISSSEKAEKNKNWKSYFENFTPKSRSSIVIMSYVFATGYPDSLSGESKQKVQQKINQIDQEFGFDEIKKLKKSKREQKFEQKITNMSLDEKVKLYSKVYSASKIAANNSENISLENTNFGTLVDAKIKDNEGAVLLKVKEDDGDTEKESKSIIKQKGEWRWKEVF